MGFSNFGNAEVAAYLASQHINDLGVARNGACLASARIPENRVFFAFSEQLAAVFSQVLEQGAPFHGVIFSERNRFADNFCRRRLWFEMLSLSGF